MAATTTQESDAATTTVQTVTDERQVIHFQGEPGAVPLKIKSKLDLFAKTTPVKEGFTLDHFNIPARVFVACGKNGTAIERTLLGGISTKATHIEILKDRDNGPPIEIDPHTAVFIHGTPGFERYTEEFNGPVAKALAGIMRTVVPQQLLGEKDTTGKKFILTVDIEVPFIKGYGFFQQEEFLYKKEEADPEAPLGTTDDQEKIAKAIKDSRFELAQAIMRDPEALKVIVAAVCKSCQDQLIKALDRGKKQGGYNIQMQNARAQMAFDKATG